MYIKQRSTNRKMAGDTIVEVLIAVAIIGLVVSLSYATAQRSLKTGQAAQERIEALKVAESQVETLKAMRTPTGTQNIFVDPAPDSFCVDPSTATIITQTAIAPNLTSIQSNDIPTGINTFDTDCRDDGNNRYHVAITRTDNMNAGKEYSTFTVRVLWEGIISSTNNGVQEVNLVYKLHRAQ